MNTLQVGDLLLREKTLGVMHVGVWAGAGLVFHNAPNRGEHISPLEEFSGGKPVLLQKTNADPVAAATRIHARLAAPQRYDLVRRNCEHSAYEIVTGIASSPVVKSVA